LNKIQIAKRYGRALMSTANTEDIPKVIEELSAFSRLLDENKKLKLFFIGQIFSEEERDNVIKALLPHLKLSKEGERFLLRIITHGHLPAIKEIIRVSTVMYNEKIKKVKALVISPVSLDGNYIERLRSVLKRLTQRDVEIERQLDPSLIGGFIVKVGSIIYDSSLKGQLRLLRAQLTR
jgi:ATP synthase F1 delta subunit